MKNYLNIKSFCGLAALLFVFSTSAIAQSDNCAGAGTIAPGVGIITNGSTVDLSNSGLAFCGTSNTAADGWYQIVGTGADLTADLCTGTSYDSKLSIYSGSCGALNCEGGNDDFCGV